MLRATAFPFPNISVSPLTRSATQTNTCQSLPLTRAIHSHFSLVSCFEFQQFRPPRVNLRASRRCGPFPANRKKHRRRDAGAAGMDDEDDDDDDDVGDEFDEDEDDVDGDGDGDDGEGTLPLAQMRKWFEKKPKGFGEGKVYDTSVEDKLLEEMLQSKKAQDDNLKKLKNNPVNHGSIKTDQKKDAVVPIGGRVCLVNLPKKKNIHRDLKSTLQGIPGIMNIVPAVSGNKKTRDPICKGFAFVDFKRKEDAVRFVELYSGQTITFGKIQKQIKCELLDAQSSYSTSTELSKSLNTAPRLMVSAFEEDSSEASNVDDSGLSSWDSITSDELDDSDDLENQIYGEEHVGENPASATALNVDYDDSVEVMIDLETDSLLSEQVDRSPIAEQNSSAKVKQERKKSKEKAKKVSKLNVPGSAKRLKVKEKAVLSDVFSKYGLKAGLASKNS